MFALTVGLAVLAWLVLVGDSHSGIGADANLRAGASVNGDTVVGELAIGPAPQPGAAPVSERTLLDLDAPADATRSAGPGVVRGRCLDENGAPLACALTVRSPKTEVPMHRDVRYAAMDGTFELAVPSGIPLEVVVRAPGKVTRSAPMVGVEPGAVHDVGDVTMAPGRRVVGTVRNEDGAAAAGVLVSLHREPRGAEMRQSTRPLRVVEARSDSSGGLYFADHLAPGRWRVLMSRTVLAPTGVLNIVGGGSEYVLDVKVGADKEGSEITGTVFDDAGQPVAGASVRAAGLASGSGHEGDADTLGPVVAVGRTASDGGFVLRCRNSEAKPVRLVVDGPGMQPEVDSRVRAWGERNVQLVLRRPAAIAVHVSTRQGHAVGPFALYVFPPRPPDLTSLRARSRGRHQEGVAFAHGIPAGDHVVLVESLAGGLVQGDLLRFHHHGGPARYDVTLDQPVRRRLRCLGAADRPVSGAVVELLLPLVDTAITRQTPAAKLMDLWSCRGDRALRVVSAITDARGEVDLEAHPDARYTLRIKDAHHASYLGELVLGAAPPLIEVCMPTGATVRGCLYPPQFVRQLRHLGSKPRLSLLAASGEDGEKKGATVEAWLPIDASGGFTFTHVDVGEWRLRLSWTVQGREMWGEFLEGEFSAGSESQPVISRRFDGSSLQLGPRRPDTQSSAAAPRWYGATRERTVEVATVAGLAEGEDRAVSASVAHLLYGSLRGRVVRPVGQALKRVWLTPVADGAGFAANVELDADGCFWAWLEPGTYAVDLRARGGRRVRASATEVTLLAGQATEATFVVDAVEVEFAVVDARGSPAHAVKLSVRQQGADEGASFTLGGTDAEGKTSSPLRPGTYVVEYEATALTSFSVAADGTPPVVRVSLPHR